MRATLIFPHGSLVFGSLAAILSAALLYCDGSIWLFTKGARSATVRPAWQAGDAMADQSPASTAAVGTKLMLSDGSCRVIVPWYPPKKNSLFFMMGPPIVPPN